VRGSGSIEVRSDELRDLGEIHYGRKKVQPSRQDLREFHSQAEEKLFHPIMWFDEAKRQAIAEAFSEVIARQKYTVWACAILSNHAHLCIRRHREDAITMWTDFATASRQALSANHPVSSARPYKVFMYTPDDVWARIRYVENNPTKERLPEQKFPFVTPYNNWPFHNRKQ
jgi:REP element-mobilizing transposase RayT